MARNSTTVWSWIWQPVLVVLATTLWLVLGSQSARAEGRFEELGSIGGGYDAVVEHDGRAYMAQGDQLLVTDAAGLGAARVVGRMRVPAPLLLDLAAGEDLLFAAAGLEGLLVLDVSDPKAPQQVGVLDGLGIAMSVAVAGATVFVADETGWLHVVNVAEPSQPRVVGRVAVPGPASRLSVAGGLAWVVVRDRRVVAVDVTLPDEPRHLASFDLSASDVLARGRYVYVATQYGLVVLDAGGPLPPRVVAESGSSPLSAVATTGDVVWGFIKAAGLFDLVAWDVTDPSRPQALGHAWRVPSAPVSYVELSRVRLAGMGSRLALTIGKPVLWVIQVRDPAHPALERLLESTSGGRQLTLSANLAAVGGTWHSLALVDVSDVRTPHLIATWNDRGPGRTLAVGDWLYATSETGLDTLHLNEGSVTAAGRYNARAEAWDLAQLDEGHLVVLLWLPAPVRTGALAIVSLADPAWPREVARMSLPAEARRVAVADHRAHVSLAQDGLATVDLADLQRPRLVDHFSLHDSNSVGIAVAPDGSRFVGAAGYRDYLRTGGFPRGPGLWVLGATESGASCVSGSLHLEPNVLDIGNLTSGGGLAYRDGRVFLAAGRAGLRVIDVTDTGNPVDIGGWRPAAPVTDVVLRDEEVFVLTAPWYIPGTSLQPSGGLHVLRWVEPPPSPMPGPAPSLALRQALPFELFLPRLTLERCR